MASNISKKSQPPKKANNKIRKPDLEVKAVVEPTNRPKALTIVGIGASAGGLKALQVFFNALPSDTGLAFVVITHLHPEHESHMAELLQTHTQMPAMQVNKKVKVEANHIYVIPPNRSIIMADSYLDTMEFTEPHGRRTPVDHFFRSLAKGHSESVAVILSGGGTDGSVGVKDVKEQGGLLLVQHPEDAEYDSMPRAAISTGLADVVLPAHQLALKLAEYIKHVPQLPHDTGQLSSAEMETLQRILAQVHARTGHDFNQYKRSTILRRVERRMQLNSFTTLESYLDFLRHTPNETTAMFNDILIGVTNFFRDRDSWQALEQKVIPALMEKKNLDDGIRIWSVGCATGEEAYGLAILLFEQVARLNIRPHIQIFASDLDESSIAHAREGIYPAAIEADLSPERLERFFTSEGEYYRVKRELRDAILFTTHNVLRDPPFSRQDLIACRNVLIYLQREIQENVFDIFHYALNAGGYLFLGSSESAEHVPELFNVVDKPHRIYQVRPWGGGKVHMPMLPTSLRRVRTSQEHRDEVRPLVRSMEHAPEDVHRRALESNAPPSLVINERSMIVHVSETAGRYLQQPKGPITGDLLKLIRPELQLELRTAIFRAFEKDRATLSRPVLVQFDGHPHRVALAIRPRTGVSTREGEQERQALVVFLEDELDELPGTKETQTKLPADELERIQMIAQLEAEVLRLREQLQFTIEESDSSNEEMKAANEELQSLNEEYRSATEELETSKEELQSVNEELQTVNSDMRSKLEELARAHEELDNLLGATEIGVLFLDRELRIQRFTKGVNTLFNIMPGDRGRPIRHLTHKMKYEWLTEDASHVLRDQVPLELEVQTENDNWFLLRMSPYLTTADSVLGVVISFVDINKLKGTQKQVSRSQEDQQTLEERVLERTRELDRVNQRLSQARDLFENLFDTNLIPTSITNLDNGTFINVNEAYLKYYGLRYEDLIGHAPAEFHLPLDLALRPALIARLKKETKPIRDLEMETQLPSGEMRTVLASLQIVLVDDIEALMLTFVDITERVRAERDIRNAATSLNVAEQAERQRISQILHDDLQQNIFAVKVQLSFLGDMLSKNDTAGIRADLQQIDQWLAQAIATTRQLSVDLSPPILSEEGIVEALLWLASQTKIQYHLDVNVEWNDGTQISLQDDVRVIVLQSVRELLFNVVKHAGAQQAQIKIEHTEQHMRIAVSDDGKGFDPKALQTQISHGLKKMRDRLFLVGCSLTVESEVNKGTRITIEAPTQM